MSTRPIKRPGNAGAAAFHCRSAKSTWLTWGTPFPVDLLKCPSCGLVFVPEALAMGKMLEVEKICWKLQHDFDTGTHMSGICFYVTIVLLCLHLLYPELPIGVFVIPSRIEKSGS